MDDFLDLFRNFELKKREVSPDKNDAAFLRIPVSLGDVAKQLTRKTISQTIDSSRFGGKVSVLRDKMKIDTSVFVSFFEKPVKSITDHVQILLNETTVHGCQTIVMVGGFSESKILQTKVKEKFQGLKVIVPR